MQRKLTAILSADVVGYSGLMEADESGTLERLKANRTAIFDPLVSTNGGRVFKLLGDGALAEFPSVVSAVTCALAIQEATARGEPGVAPEKRIRYRIGVNLGDIIIDGDDIYGEGVNVAARLQTLASKGGVAVSRTVRDNLEGKIACAFEDLGEHQVKDHERPVHAFSVRPTVGEKSEAGRMEQRHKPSICVLPFANMSDDSQQEYFSDGISEDIITDLSKVSALTVVSRNSAFQYKGKHVDLPRVARELKVSHVLEGSVRKAGARVRITAQLIDGATNEHVWAERYDRDLSDIFALQDEISEAIVKALKLKLVPEEKKAIEQRGTENVEAYNVYLMARNEYAAALVGDVRRYHALVRLCQRATEIDPNYARAWALMAHGQNWLRNSQGVEMNGGLPAAERALALDANLAEAHAAKAYILIETGNLEGAEEEVETALRLDPESLEANRTAANLRFRQHRIQDSIRYYEKAATLADTDFVSFSMMVSCLNAIGDRAGARRAAEKTFARVEKVLAFDRNNASALGHGCLALAVLGQSERAKDWMRRASLIEPDNVPMHYNFACALACYLGEVDAALDMMGPALGKAGARLIQNAKNDPDLDSVRDHPRFKAMIAAAEARLSKEATPAGTSS